ncbi:retinol dehydrogenase 7 [Battus philenor]|uniref:retinol dehydrogenase 7 n=1 Tax=Battus philenor TaxID=42288 RepID=UPI0035CFF8CE
MPLKRVVAITGCDSGLGWAIAARTAREGLITVAGMLRGTETDASRALKNLSAYPYSLDVTNINSVVGFHEYVQSVINDHPDSTLYAVVNNAGVMTIGDYEWQTPKIIENTVNVNLLGPMRVVSSFLPELRKSAKNNLVRPRIINVASHCGLQPLPGFGPYSASKAGLLAWTRSLRHEQSEYGLNVVAFIPGGFITSSNLMSYQKDQGDDMMEHLSEEQRALYSKKIKTLCTYLGAAANEARFDSMKDENIIETFVKALMDEQPKELYKVESWRYKFYYNLFKLPLSDGLHRWLINKFLNFPQVA